MKLIFWFTIILLIVLTIISRIRRKFNHQYKPNNTIPIVGLSISLFAITVIVYPTLFNGQKLDFTKLIFPILFLILFIDHLRRNKQYK